MRFETTAHAKEQTRLDYMCFASPCLKRSGASYVGISENNGKPVLIVQRGCKSVDCGGVLEAIPISESHMFERVVRLMLTEYFNNTRQLINRFVLVSKDFNHNQEKTSCSEVLGENLAVLRTAYLLLNEIDLQSDDINEQPFDNTLIEQERGFALLRKNEIYLNLPNDNNDTINKIKCLIQVIDDREIEYLNNATDSYIMTDVKPTVDRLRDINKSMYFRKGSIFLDIQLSIYALLKSNDSIELETAELELIQEALAVLNTYKDATIDGSAGFKPVCSAQTALSFN